MVTAAIEPPHPVPGICVNSQPLIMLAVVILKATSLRLDSSPSIPMTSHDLGNGRFGNSHEDEFSFTTGQNTFKPTARSEIIHNLLNNMGAD
jgi:hypothetical protein